jgi:hypothetical protein
MNSGKPSTIKQDITLVTRYTLGACYLYFKRNAEKFGVRAIGQKIQ